MQTDIVKVYGGYQTTKTMWLFSMVDTDRKLIEQLEAELSDPNIVLGPGTNLARFRSRHRELIERVRAKYQGAFI